MIRQASYTMVEGSNCMVFTTFPTPIFSDRATMIAALHLHQTHGCIRTNTVVCQDESVVFVCGGTYYVEYKTLLGYSLMHVLSVCMCITKWNLLIINENQLLIDGFFYGFCQQKQSGPGTNQSLKETRGWYTFPVSTVSNERFFSVLKCVKNIRTMSVVGYFLIYSVYLYIW